MKMSKLWIISSFILGLSVVVFCLLKEELPETGFKAVQIISPPRNTTVLEYATTKFTCSAIGTPNNITYNWYHKGVLISHLPWLGTRTSNKSEVSLIIQSTTTDDSGKFTCEATNGIGEPDTAFAYLRVDHPARVTYSPARQYLPLGLSGIVKCYIQASPPVDFVIWTKDHKEFDPSTQQNVQILANGSLYFSEITQQQEGLYRCKPYNSNGIERGSDPMEVIVKDPPKFKVEPAEYYMASVDGNVTMFCEGVGIPKPTVTWKRVGTTSKLPKYRTFFNMNQSITITNLRKKDFGVYECSVKNEIATLVAQTKLVMNSSYKTGLDADIFQPETINYTLEEYIESTEPSIIEITDQNLNIENKPENNNNTFMANPRKIAEVIFVFIVVTIIILSVCLVFICKKLKQHKKRNVTVEVVRKGYCLKQNPPKWTFKCLKLTQRLKSLRIASKY